MPPHIDSTPISTIIQGDIIIDDGINTFGTSGDNDPEFTITLRNGDSFTVDLEKGGLLDNQSRRLVRAEVELESVGAAHRPCCPRVAGSDLAAFIMD